MASVAAPTPNVEATSQLLAWTDFWREQGPRSRCVDGAWDIHQLLADHWTSVSSRLRKGAKVLDLGCGSGVVARTLALPRPDLQVVGIDAAQIPTETGQIFRLLSATPMEDLPFSDQSFHAAVSQFGFEYGDTCRSAKELARVLIPGGHFSFIVHHSLSPIVRASRFGNQAQKALVGPSIEASFLAGDAVALAVDLQALLKRYPGEDVVLLAVQRLRSAVHQPATNRLRIWEAIVDALAPGAILADALEASSVAPDEINRWLESFSEPLRVRRARILTRRSEPLAWTIEGVRDA